MTLGLKAMFQHLSFIPSFFRWISSWTRQMTLSFVELDESTYRFWNGVRVEGLR